MEPGLKKPCIHILNVASMYDIFHLQLQ